LSDWSSDVCSSDLTSTHARPAARRVVVIRQIAQHDPARPLVDQARDATDIIIVVLGGEAVRKGAEAELPRSEILQGCRTPAALREGPEPRIAVIVVGRPDPAFDGEAASTAMHVIRVAHDALVRQFLDVAVFP